MSAGDLDADPYDGDRYDHAVRRLRHPAVNPPATPPASAGGVEAAQRQGGVEAAQRQGGANVGQIGNPA
ncbi:hypothetical protein ABZV31_05970 [Streptomyces sp. NPDC005202]|uniref:hypothetical protein n=1 Tax=Streptomyces sp. NPDC005202 TaxID=3157021 RepID=UPI0033A90BE7